MVHINNESSSMLPILHKVPQWSILWPTLFLIYINDIEKHITQGELILYADDTTYLQTNTALEILEDTMVQQTIAY